MKTGKIIGILLALAMMAGLLSLGQVVMAADFPINTIRVETIHPLSFQYGGDVSVDDSEFIVKSGSPAKVEQFRYFQKKDGEDWVEYTGGSLIEGTWRFSVRAIIYAEDGLQGNDHYFLEGPMELIVNGDSWGVDDNPYVSPNGVSYSYFASPEFVIEAPEETPQDETYAMEIKDTDLGTAEENYEPDEYVKAISYKNTSTVTLNPSQIECSTDNDDIVADFNTGAGVMSTNVTYSNTELFKATPKEGLSAGTYKTVVTLKYDADNDGSFETTLGSGTLAFTVTQPSEPVYTVTVTSDTDGSATAEPALGKSGTEVTLTATPNAGFRFKEWQVISGGVSIASDKFTIATGDVEIKAIFEEIPTSYAMEIEDTDLGTAEEYYSPDEYVKAISYKNTSTVTLNPSQIECSTDNDDIVADFNTGAGVMSTNVTYSNTELFKATPKEGLSAGTYKTVVTLKYDADNDGSFETTLGSGTLTLTVTGGEDPTPGEPTSEDPTPEEPTPEVPADDSTDEAMIASIRYAAMILRQKRLAEEEAAKRAAEEAAKKALETTATPALPFTDVTSASPYYDDIRFVYDQDIMIGMSNTTFGENIPLNRAMVVTVLWRMDGEIQVNTFGTFSDVPTGEWYSDAVEWAASHDIVLGYGDGTFGPMDDVTREQLAAILFRYAKFKGYDVSIGEDTNILSYDDAFTWGQWAVPALQWACGADVIEDSPVGMLRPTEAATRGEIAHAIRVFCEEVAK